MISELDIAVISLTAVLSTGAGSHQDKSPVPDRTSRNRILNEIKILFQEDYSKKGRNARLSLSTKLLEEGVRSEGDTQSSFVLIYEALTIASREGDISTSFRAIKKLRESFDLENAQEFDSALKMKLNVLRNAQRLPLDRDRARKIARMHFSVAQEAAAAGQFGLAKDFLKHGSSLSRSYRDTLLAVEIASFSRELPEQEREYASASKIDPARKVDITNHKMNLDTGRYLCFVLGNWRKGLEYLQWTNMVGVTDAANKDISNPTEVPGQMAAAEAWYRLANKERHSLHKARYKRRARYWYELACLGSTGVQRLKAELRLDELDASLSGPINLLRMIHPNRDAVNGDWNIKENSLLCSQGPAVRLEIPYTPPQEYNLTVVANRIKGRDAIAIGLVHPGSQFTVWIDASPTKGPLSGFGVLDNKTMHTSPVTIKGTHLENGRSHEITCFVRTGGITVYVDNTKVLEWKGDLNRLTEDAIWKTNTPKTLFLGAWYNQVTFSKISLTPISGPGKRIR